MNFVKKHPLHRQPDKQQDRGVTPLAALVMLFFTRKRFHDALPDFSAVVRHHLVTNVLLSTNVMHSRT